MSTDYTDSLEIRLETSNSKLERIDVLHELAWEFAGIDNEKSLKYALQSHDLSLTTPNKDLIATSYNRIGLAYDYMANFQEALNNYNACLQIRELYGGAKEVSAALNNIGAVYYYSGNYDKAIDYYFRALRDREFYAKENPTEGNKLIAQSYNNIALVLKVQGKMKKALTYYRLSLKLKEAEGDDLGRCTTLSNVGNLFLQMNQLDSATLFMEEALVLATQLENAYNITMIQGNLGLVYAQKGESEKAEEIYLNILQKALDAGKTIEAATAQINLSSLYLDQKEFINAREYAESALSTGQETASLVVQENANNLLYHIYKEQNQLDQAMEYYEAYVSIKDSILNLSVAKTTDEVLIKYETQKKRDSIQKLGLENELLAKNDTLNQEKIKRSTTFTTFLIITLVLVLVGFILILQSIRAKKRAQEVESNLRNENFEREIQLLRTRLESTLEDQTKENFSINQGIINDYLNNPLTERELDVLAQVADGKTNKEIAEALFVSVNTIKTHILNIYVKLDVQNRTQAAVKAGSLNILK